MKEFRFRLILILGAIALSLYLLWPTFQDYRNSKHTSEILSEKEKQIKEANPKISKDNLKDLLNIVEDSIKLADPSILENRQQRVKLGLDLQGGMRVVLEVNTAKLLEKIAKNPDDTFKKVLNDATAESNLSDESVVDIFGRIMNQRDIRISRYFGRITQDDDEILDKLKQDAEDAVARAMEIIRNRVDQYGVSEPSIQRQGTRRIIVELPGVAKEEEAKQLLQGTALLEFRLVKEPEFAYSVMERIDNVLAGKTLEDTTASDTTTAETASADTTLAENDTTQQQLSEEEFKKQHPFFAVVGLNTESGSADGYVLDKNKENVQRMLNRPDVQNAIPNNIEFLFSAKSFTTQDGQSFFTLYMVNKEPELTGGVITDAIATIDQMSSNWIVSMEMNGEGATQWARITGANVDKRIAIILDGVVFSAPVVRNKITGGRSQIEGMAGASEAKLLEIVLKAGALPAPVDIIEERTVGPSLGQDSINSGFMSALLGYIFVGAFMIFWYRKSGSIAALSLTFSVLFILGILAGFKATLTLPGIAGIILTIGMAVDANVLIFERIREELATGKTMKAAIDSGFAKAYSAIIDSNITTFFTGLILYQFGTGPIQGFALTLMIGIVASLFSALVIVRVMANMLVAKGVKLTIG
ncbi:MAG: protein-export membrane protein SecD [Ignavibacteria bacterium CG2_30_36_16]|nr:protein translocase subunit SecD [Ignavibacteria bacterium]OIP62535.1 MAG: protein-export membrane protein SecD [Ignavibacteria bacterium CG2_30_36_16]PJA99858.1 MAG: protein translocase subunit SecD [Ignavibacteria bacterium CG_4_9_14_3_um_filter_36_18]